MASVKTVLNIFSSSHITYIEKKTTRKSEKSSWTWNPGLLRILKEATDFRTYVIWHHYGKECFIGGIDGHIERRRLKQDQNGVQNDVDYR